MPRTHLDPHFFKRDKNGLVKLRMNLTEEEALLIEEAAGPVPVMVWIHQTLGRRARNDIKRAERAGGYEIVEEP